MSQTKISPNAQHVLHRLVNDRDDLVHEGRWSLVSRVGIMNPDGTTVPEDESVEMATVMELVAGLIVTETKIAFVQPNWAAGSPPKRKHSLVGWCAAGRSRMCCRGFFVAQRPERLDLRLRECNLKGEGVLSPSLWLRRQGGQGDKWL